MCVFSTVSHFPAAALLIFAALCVLTILMLVAILQQEKYVASTPPLFKKKNPLIKCCSVLSLTLTLDPCLSRMLLMPIRSPEGSNGQRFCFLIFSQVDGSPVASCSWTQNQRNRLRTAEGTNT